MHIPPGLKQGANRRLAGEDSKPGDVLVEVGARLRPQEVATAAATGLDRLRCYAPLKVAIVSTGDEILRPGEAFAPGKVYDANAAMLEGLIRAAGAEAGGFGHLAGQGRARPRGSVRRKPQIRRCRDFRRREPRR